MIPRGLDRPGSPAEHDGRGSDDLAGSSPDSGETLLELLIALAIIGIAMVAVVGAMSTGIVISDVHRKQAVAGASVSGYAETAKQDAKSSGYQSSCSPTYASTFTVPTGYVKSIVAVSFWTGTAFQASCSATADIGVQRVTLRVSSSDGRASESLVVVVRKPCRPSDAVCT